MLLNAFGETGFAIFRRHFQITHALWSKIRTWEINTGCQQSSWYFFWNMSRILRKHLEFFLLIKYVHFSDKLLLKLGQILRKRKSMKMQVWKSKSTYFKFTVASKAEETGSCNLYSISRKVENEFWAGFYVRTRANMGFPDTLKWKIADFSEL